MNRLAQVPSLFTSNHTPLQASSYAYRKRGIGSPVPNPSSRLQEARCSDTSERFFLVRDSVSFYTNSPALTKDGHVLISGEYSKWNGYSDDKAFLLKTDQKGNVIWLKTYDSLHHVAPYHYINYQKVLELKDGSIFLAGRTNSQTGENDLIIFTKTDAQGNLIWSRLYKSRLWTRGNGSADYWAPHEVKEDPASGDIYISAAFWDSGKSLTKLNAANGAILWSRSYDPWQYAVFDSPLGLDIRSDEIRFFGRFLGYNNGVVSVSRINKQTGDTLQNLFFKSADTTGTKVDFLGNDQLTVLQNGNYALSGKTYGQYQYMYNGLTPLYQAAVLELDSNLNFVRAYAFKNHIESNGYNSRVTVFPDGTALFSMLRFESGYTADLYYVQTRDGQIVKQRRRHYSGEGIPYEPTAVRFGDGSDVIIRLLGDSASNSNKIEFLKMHLSDSSSLCIGVDDASTSIYPFRYEPLNWGIDSVRSNLFYEAAMKAITIDTVVTAKKPGCFTVSYCDSLKLIVPEPVICLSKALMLTIRKNKACGSTIPLRIDTSVVKSMTMINDSTCEIRFRKAWSGYIAGNVQGCSLIWDSVYVQILQAPEMLTLGPDTALCTGNSLILNARKGFASYLWQDGSTDSVFTVTEPGLYHVKVKDACGGEFKDTVMVTAAPPVPFDIGPDRTKCNNDTLQLTASPGFLNYTWSNNYNISSTSSQTVVVNPLIDTAYYIKAEKTPGCFAYDTVRIHVLTSPPINLGPDKNFCNGDSAVFDAGNGFNQYAWSNGSNTQQIVLKTAGTFSVMGITAQGCKTYDTVRVMNVFPNPAVSLDHTNFLCTGTSRVLDAGIFSSYLWNDGSTTQKITADNLGTYAVQVTDNNGCKGSDTTAITELRPPPQNFLPADTAICAYGSLVLKPMLNYNSYLWSNTASAASITIRQPGVYWLQVTDANHCIGRDTILVNAKDCMNGFYIPTAFTPDGDGKNDIFRPLLFGQVKKFNFTVYNRWGQRVFQTSELTKGWNGIFAGTMQNSNIFIWTCTYQFEGMEVKTEKGTVMLIR